MRVSGGEAVVKTLINCDVAIVYGLPGTHVLDIYEALRNESQIKHVLTMHEINAAFMADAQGRLTGRPGVCLFTGGPGATNAVTAIAQAHAEASPVVQITGHCGTNEKIQPPLGVDDWNFLLKIYSPITKWSVQINRVEEIAPTLTKAFETASSGRPGPVHVEIPQDILHQSVEFQNPIKTASGIEHATDEKTIGKVADALTSAKRPVVIVGNGVLREFCWEDVMKLAQIIDAPIVTAPFHAVSAIPHDFPLFVGYDWGFTPHPLIDLLVGESDVVITFGLDLRERLTCIKVRDHAVIHVHNDVAPLDGEESIISAFRPLIDVSGSVKQTLKLLLSTITPERSVERNTQERVLNIRKKIKDDVSSSIKWGRKPMHPGEVSAQLRRVLGDDTIITLDVGQSSHWMNTVYTARKSNTVLAPGRYASMGFALPAAIAAKFTFPEREVVAVMGDGGFLMSCMDFPTVVKHRLAIKVIVMSDRHYGAIWRSQKELYKGHTFATDIQVPDFERYAESFGARGFSVDDPGELTKVLEEALSLDEPVIISVHTDHDFPIYIPGRMRRAMMGTSIGQRIRAWRIRTRNRESQRKTSST